MTSTKTAPLPSSAADRLGLYAPNAYDPVMNHIRLCTNSAVTSVRYSPRPVLEVFGADMATDGEDYQWL